jgi:hypothetical protein
MSSSTSVATPESLWRAAAHDSMEGSGDFPEAILMLIEVLNGPKGRPSYQEFSYKMCASGQTNVQITDDGAGMPLRDSGRFLTWSSSSSVDAHSKYGHGTKKFLAKHGPYRMPWSVETRSGRASDITRYNGPWNAADTEREEVPADERVDFPRTGFRISFTCDTGKLFNHGETPSAALLFARIKELICTRKSQAALDAIDYRVRIEGTDGGVVEETSRAAGWRSFKATLEDLAARTPYAGVERILQHDAGLVDRHSVLRLTTFCVGLKVVKGFPIYGSREGDKLTRIHVFNNDTMIEAINPRTITGGSRYVNPHFVTFVECLPIDPTNHEHMNAMPTPATTKVSYRRECPIFQTVLSTYALAHPTIITCMKPHTVASLKSRLEAASAPAPPAGAPAAAAALPLPASPLPEWTPPAETDLTPDILRRLSKDEVEKTCDHYGLPKTDKKADNILLLSAIPMTGDTVLAALSEVDLDDDENRLLKSLLHVAITKGRRV